MVVAVVALAQSALILAATLAGALAWRRRSRRRLNAALHELRRPLQAIALAPEVDVRAAWMDQAAAALAALDREVNGGGPGSRGGPVDLAELLADARRRWAPLAEIRFEGGAPGSTAGDPRQLGAALDNLIANAVDKDHQLVQVVGCGPSLVDTVGAIPARWMAR